MGTFTTSVTERNRKKSAKSSQITHRLPSPHARTHSTPPSRAGHPSTKIADRPSEHGRPGARLHRHGWRGLPRAVRRDPAPSWQRQRHDRPPTPAASTHRLTDSPTHPARASLPGSLRCQHPRRPRRHAHRRSRQALAGHLIRQRSRRQPAHARGRVRPVDRDVHLIGAIDHLVHPRVIRRYDKRRAIPSSQRRVRGADGAELAHLGEERALRRRVAGSTASCGGCRDRPRRRDPLRRRSR